jgi:hypothetical protein
VASIREFNLVKLFVGVLVSDSRLASDVEEALIPLYGAIDHSSIILPFTSTDYYAMEMGANVQRAFFSFEQLIEAERLPAIKKETNALEETLAALMPAFPRPVNLDPGYVENAKVILASAKNFYHRIHLGGGIFGEVTMHFRTDHIQFFPWTFPDYQTREYQEFFLKVRQIYRSQLKQMCMLRPKRETN